MSFQKRIAVIGAGPSGLTAVKACKEENVDVVCFEIKDHPGGLWRYHEDKLDGVSSIMKTTSSNTSKERNSYSDFPPPADFPNFLHNSLVYKYLIMYAEKFDLLRHIRYHHKVLGVEYLEDSDQWKVTTENTQSKERKEDIFDGVMVCVGCYCFPKLPKFRGQEKFKGQILHTQSLKNCEAFSGKSVVVVGIGNSGVDAAVDSTFLAKQVYLSTRTGNWVLSRIGDKGLPYDICLTSKNSRKRFLINSFRSYDAVCNDTEKLLEKQFDHTTYNLRPKHRVWTAHTTVNDFLPSSILSGKIKIKGDISRFEEEGIVFENDDEKLTKVDVVILATGYERKCPFLKDDFINTNYESLNLYKLIIPPALKYRNMAIIATTELLGPIFPIAEMQCRWFMQIFTGKTHLPTQSGMEKDIKFKHETNSKFYGTSNYNFCGVFLPYVDELAAQIGAKPDFLTMAITDAPFFKTCVLEPMLPYQYRLIGPHKWEGARDAILSFEKRLKIPLNTRYKSDEAFRGQSDVSLFSSISTFFACVVVFVILLYRKYF